MKKILCILCISFIGINSSFSQLTVTPGTSQADLVNAITAGGIAVSNITTNGVIPSASGTFICGGACNIGISGGIILTSGSASIAADSNTYSGQGADIGGTGDADLNTLTTGNTLDANVLEFDFIAVSDTAVFNYIFASEEYSDYVGQFNDVFGFFINGPGISGIQNIALVPGTGAPISINNINNGQAATGVIPTGPCTNCAYFLDNTNTGTSYPYTTAYDGLTTVLTAVAANIQPGQTYHLKLAVADVLDHLFDTGVFLEAGSFRVAAPPALFVGGSRVAGNTVHICEGSSVSLSAPQGFSYLWSTGATAQAITVSTAGTYSVMITGSNINFPVASPAITFIVDNVTIPNPVLTHNGNIISSSVNFPVYDYSWTFNGNPLAGEYLPSIVISQLGCYAITVRDPGGCYVTSDTLCVISLGINEINSENQVHLYPNPFSESAQLVFNNSFRGKFALKIFDVTGRMMNQFSTSNSQFTIQRGALNSGIYFYELMNEKGKSFKGKFVIN